jgi:hypothetical protein
MKETSDENLEDYRDIKIIGTNQIVVLEKVVVNLIN